MNNGFTQVPNILFDAYLPHLSLAELKVLLVVIRQTLGWVHKKSGKRKVKDRITHAQFISKTGLSRKIISKTIQSLNVIGLITISDYRGNVLDTPQKRKGKSYLYYAYTGNQPVHCYSATSAKNTLRPVQKSQYNKINYIKEKDIQETVKTIGEIIHIYKSKYFKE